MIFSDFHQKNYWAEVTGKTGYFLGPSPFAYSWSHLEGRVRNSKFEVLQCANSPVPKICGIPKDYLAPYSQYLTTVLVWTKKSCKLQAHMKRTFPSTRARTLQEPLPGQKRPLPHPNISVSRWGAEVCWTHQSEDLVKFQTSLELEERAKERQERVRSTMKKVLVTQPCLSVCSHMETAAHSQSLCPWGHHGLRPVPA